MNLCSDFELNLFLTYFEFFFICILKIDNFVKYLNLGSSPISPASKMGLFDPSSSLVFKINVNSNFDHIFAKIAKNGFLKNTCFTKMTSEAQKIFEENYLTVVETETSCILINALYQSSKKLF